MTYSISHLQLLQLMTLSSLHHNAFHYHQISVKAAGLQHRISKVCLIKWPMIQHSFVECYIDSYIITRNGILKMRLIGHMSKINLKINLSHFLSHQLQCRLFNYSKWIQTHFVQWFHIRMAMSASLFLSHALCTLFKDIQFILEPGRPGFLHEELKVNVHQEKDILSSHLSWHFLLG